MRGSLGTLLLLAAAGALYAGEYRDLLRAGTSLQWDNVGVGDAGSGSGLLATLLEAGGGEPQQLGGAGPGFSGSGSGSGTPFIALELPVCAEDELLEFNGTDLLCKKIPERKCICPEPMSGSGDVTVPPEPPGGCTIFQPPVGGAFVCMRMADLVIYCSVLCDNEHEFSTFPLNPYFCGVPSKFKWSDFTNVTHEELPKCTGFRHTLRPLHREQYYIPDKCSNLNTTAANVVKKDFCCLLQGIPSRRVCADINCDTTDIFIQCPP